MKEKYVIQKHLSAYEQWLLFGAWPQDQVVFSKKKQLINQDKLHIPLTNQISLLKLFIMLL
jgi:hypothetical protein